MSDYSFLGVPFGREQVEHLLAANTGTCWWCQQRPATTGEHKFKRTDLTRMMSDDLVFWRDHEGNLRPIRGKSGATRDRYGVVKFEKSLCAPCNNERSQPFDSAYDEYSQFARTGWSPLFPGANLERLYGHAWPERNLDLARYYAKHLGCRMIRSGVPVPDSLRAFLDGERDMPDAHMALVTTTSIRMANPDGLTISPDAVRTDEDFTRFTNYIFVAYVGPLGVRYEWRDEEIDPRSQFFHYPNPVVNRFRDEAAVFDGRTEQMHTLTLATQVLEKSRAWVSRHFGRRR